MEDELEALINELGGTREFCRLVRGLGGITGFAATVEAEGGVEEFRETNGYVRGSRRHSEVARRRCYGACGRV